MGQKLKKILAGTCSGFIDGFLSAFTISLDPIHPRDREIITNSFSDDYQAIKGDWENIGKDIEKAIHKFDKQHNSI